MAHTSPTAREAVAARITALTAGWAQGASLEEIRAGFEAFLAGPCPGTIETTLLAGRPATRTTLESAAPGKLILFFHGGGFQIGSPRSHASLIARLAQQAGVTVLAPDYRLAPEHRFPAAAEDCFAAYRAVLDEGFRPQDIALAGDSAGGNLVLGVALRAKAEGLGLPAALALISPWLDPGMRGASYTTRAERDIFSKPEALRLMARTYLGRGGDAAHWLVNPLDADLAGLPPILVHAGDWDITLDDSTLLAARAREAGVACDLKVWPEMYHHFQVFAELPEAEASLAEIGRFLRGALAP